MHSKAFLIGLCLVIHASADLKCASRPKEGYRIINENGAIPFVTTNIWHKYMIPDHFGFSGGRRRNGLMQLRTFGGFGGRFRLLQESEIEELEKSNTSIDFLEESKASVDLRAKHKQVEESEKQFPGMFGPWGRGRGRGRGMPGRGGGMPMLPPTGQKYRNYDQFLRSNIDNEHDNRNFDNNYGRDELPFRTNQTAVLMSFQSNKWDHAKRWPKMGPIDLRQTIKPGETSLVPMRWNNPHASEVEVNIWIFNGDKHPVVVPIRKPSCSGEGHQDNIISFTIPKDFPKLGAKIPWFKGCNADTRPMCTLQVYGHSVESRQYAFAWPIIIPGHDVSQTTTSTDQIKPITTDPALDLSVLRDICLPTTDPSGDIKSAMPRWARLVSDQYTHAYLNSDYSPYSGQQHEGISKNMQASCINKMWAANHGELGKSILPAATKERLDRLENLEERIYKRYEDVANMIIKRIERAGMMRNTGVLKAMGTTQRLATCFRCAEVGAVNPTRLNTNTYIPAFQLPSNAVQAAKRMIPPWYRNLINEKGQVQIYTATLQDLLPHLINAMPYGIIYQTAKLKNTLADHPDATGFRKRNAQGTTDGGVHAAQQAKVAWAAEHGCPIDCLRCNAAKCQNSWDNCKQPLIKGTLAVCIKGPCAKCVSLYTHQGKTPATPKVTPLAKQISKSGLPDYDHQGGVDPYPAEDDSEDEVGKDVDDTGKDTRTPLLLMEEERVVGAKLATVFSGDMISEEMVEKEHERMNRKKNCGTKAVYDASSVKERKRSKKSKEQRRRRRRTSAITGHTPSGVA